MQLSTNFTNATNLLTLTGLPDHLPAGAPRLLLHSPLHSLLLFFLFLNLFLLFFLLWTRFLLAIFLSRLRFGTISCRLTLFLFRPNTLAIAFEATHSEMLQQALHTCTGSSGKNAVCAQICYGGVCEAASGICTEGAQNDHRSSGSLTGAERSAAECSDRCWWRGMPFGSLSFSFVVLVHRIFLILESYFLN